MHNGDVNIHADSIIAVDDSNISIEHCVPEINGQVKFEDGKLCVFDGVQWTPIDSPLKDEGFAAIEVFVEQLTVQQLQDIYKRKEELFNLIEAKLLGKS